MKNKSKNTHQNTKILMAVPGHHTLPPGMDGMLVHRKVTSSIMIAGTNLYTRATRDNVKYSFLSKETT